MGALIAGTNGGTIGYTEMTIQGSCAIVSVSTITGTTGTEFAVEATLQDGTIEVSYWTLDGCHICGNHPPLIQNPQIFWSK